MQDMENNRFLIPNLCDLQALLMLFIVMQLLVILNMLFLFGIRFDWVHFGLVTFYVQLQAFLSASLLCIARTSLVKLPAEKAVLLAFLLLMAIAFIIAGVVHQLWLPLSASRVNSYDFIWRNALISAIVSAVALRYLYLQQQLIAQQKSELHASLLALQARIRPHFLFNTLNSIASLITIAPEKAEKMIEDLSSLIRGSLRDEVETTFLDEWQLCEAYLHIENIRLDGRLSWSCDFSNLNDQIDIPSLSLQPLLENAVYHGIQPNPKAGDIIIYAESVEDKVLVRIDNSQSKKAAEAFKHQGNNMALDNIRHRLQRLYGDSATLELKDEGERFIATMSYRLQD